MPLAVHRVTTSDSPGFRALVTIYTAAHPASERKPITLLAAMVDRPAYVFLVATLDQQVVGFAIALLFSESESASASDACLLEYMAVAEDHRNQGIGRFLFQQLGALPEVSLRYLLAEVDSDKFTSPDRADRTRRKHFYRSLGAREVEDLNYLMPPVSTSKPPAMDLMVYRSHLPDTITKPHLRAWLQGIYVNVYAQQPNDPRIDTMIEKLPQNPHLI